MTAEEAIQAYSEKFGGFPYFLFLAAPDETVVKAVESALQTGEEIKAPCSDADY